MSEPGVAESTEAVVDLLAVLAYGELTAFDRVAAAARLAPDLRRRAALSTVAAAQIANYQRLEGRLRALGAAPDVAMRPFVEPIDGFHDSTQASDWLEGLVKAYVCDQIADDFYREIAELLDGEDRDLVLDVLHDTRHADFAAAEIRAATADDRALADRLALWARRLVGEALSQAQRVAAERDGLAMLIVTSTGDLTGVNGLVKRITTAHTERMTALGLSN